MCYSVTFFFSVRLRSLGLELSQMSLQLRVNTDHEKFKWLVKDTQQVPGRAQMRISSDFLSLIWIIPFFLDFITVYVYTFPSFSLYSYNLQFLPFSPFFPLLCLLLSAITAFPIIKTTFSSSSEIYFWEMKQSRWGCELEYVWGRT